MDQKRISTDKAPRPVGPYSQAIRLGDLIFTSGVIAIDPTTGEIRGDIEVQTRQVLEFLGGILDAAGSSLDRVIKVTAFVTDLGDFATFNRVYEEYLGDVKPARSTVQVSALPKGAVVEVEAIAAV